MFETSETRILVLDDEPLMLKLLSHMLVNLGFTQVTTCTTGRSALEEIDNANDRPHIVLLDINMPEMDGLEFVRHLVDRCYTGSIILISGEDERMMQTTESLVQAHSLSTLGYLHKPFNLKNLSSLLKKWTQTELTTHREAKKAYGADEVRSAIANGELVNYYQPKVDLASGKVVGVESLVRWRHPQDGIVFPDQFIGVAEVHRLINDLTRAVVNEAFAQARIWQDNGLLLRVAINLSMDNLTHLAFADDLVSAAASAGIAPEGIVLEVTESRLMKDVSATLEILTRLRLKRFSLSIDDFGTGHSSLIQLRDIPFNELKVDRSFVHGLATNATLNAIFNSNLSLAQQLNMKMVAEGVEDQADWDFLRSTDCDLAQGYFIAKPMPADEIHDWIIRWEANIESHITVSDEC
jgi:EAL domain-containing protein (putative c-di-GMP-specific phosphodiesterase class I)/FixJ family two-component response regulator